MLLMLVIHIDELGLPSPSTRLPYARQHVFFQALKHHALAFQNIDAEMNWASLVPPSGCHMLASMSFSKHPKHHA